MAEDDEFSISSGSSRQSSKGDDGERDCDVDDSRRGSGHCSILNTAPHDRRRYGKDGSVPLAAKLSVNADS